MNYDEIACSYHEVNNIGTWSSNHLLFKQNYAHLLQKNKSLELAKKGSQFGRFISAMFYMWTIFFKKVFSCPVELTWTDCPIWMNNVKTGNMISFCSAIIIIPVDFKHWWNSSTWVWCNGVAFNGISTFCFQVFREGI